MSNYSFSLLLALISNLLIGTFVVIKKRNDSPAPSFFLLTIVLTFWLTGCFGESISESRSSALLWDKILYTGISLYPLIYFNFLFSILNIKRNKKVLTILGAISLFFLFLNYSPWRYYLIRDVARVFSFRFIAVPNILWFVLVSYVVISVVYGVLLKFSIFQKSTGFKRNQLKYLLIAYMVLTCGGSMYFLLPLAIKVPPIDATLVVVFSAIMAGTILRYRLMDIKLIFKKTMAYSLAAGLLTAFFAILVITITHLLSEFANVSSLKISIPAVLIIALLFNPLRNRIQKLIDKIFYKKTYDYMTTVNKISHELASMLNLKKIFNFVGDIIFSTMGLRNIYLLAAGPGGDYEVVYSMGGGQGWSIFKIDKNADMVRLLKTSDDIVIKDELPGIVEIIGQETIDSISNTMKPFNGEVIAPVFIDDKLSLLIVLGGKLSGDIFTDEDVNLLKIVSNQTAIAVKNASLYAEKLRSERFASMGLMSATFAHEIRNPLTSIKTFAQLFPEKFNDTEFREVFSKVVIDDVERIDGLIKDLLNFSGEKTFSRMNEVDIIYLLDETLNYVKNKLGLESKKISVEKIYKDVKINIIGDSEKLKQAFINIITNGCQAMDENGVLKVNITLNGREVDIAISDTGKGILQEEISRLFDPFYTTKPMGMGLGLAISKKIIEDHGGRIMVESEISKGTTFTVSLPMKD